MIAALLSFAGHTGQEGWLKLQMKDADFGIYYQPLSIRVMPDGKREVVTLLNYTDNKGRPASILTTRVFDCQRKTRLDVSTVQYEGHWTDGEVVASQGKDSDWTVVPPRTYGESLMNVTCRDTPSLSPQLHGQILR